MTKTIGFLPVVAKNAKVLILGSMPGELSLKTQQYYAHPRNAFWRIMEALFGIDSSAPYAQRLQGLIENHIALWDVIKVCQRSGSLDNAIDENSIEVNHFADLYQQYPNICAVFFNGVKAEQAYHRYVLPTLATDLTYLTHSIKRLPSTSPANARLNLSTKTTMWRVIYDCVYQC